MYKCGWNGCEKAYGTLNHLNAHVTMQSHGQKRTPEGNYMSYQPPIVVATWPSVLVSNFCRLYGSRVALAVCSGLGSLIVRSRCSWLVNRNFFLRNQTKPICMRVLLLFHPMS